MNITLGTYSLLALFLGQILIFSLGILVLQYYQLIEGPIVFFAAIFMILNYLIAIFFFQRIFRADCELLLLRQKETALHKVEGTLRLIRSQRHDIVNHLHTIYALLQMGKEQQAKKYVNEVESATTNIIHVSRIEVPELAALLQSKLGQAMAKNITFNIETRTDLKNCPIKPYLLVSILGNLLDNAFEAVANLSTESRFVELEVTEQKEVYIFSVSNVGSSITKELHEKIFDAGFSTKEQGRGYGLAIVRETILNHGGTIEVRTNPTTFIVTLPRKGANCIDS